MPAPISLVPSPLSILWRAGFAAFLDALFPPHCAGCGSWNREVFCPDCALQLQPIRAPLCLHCGAPFDPLAFSASICARCRAKSPHFRAARAAFVFTGPQRAAIHQLKYRQKRALAARLAPFLAHAFENDPVLAAFAPDFLVPVPLHRARLRSRGFNQSFLLASELSPLLGVPTREILIRTRNTPPQVSLKGAQRARNVRGAFAVQADFSFQNAPRVLLIDDVFTTGATLGEAAKTLRRAGAGEVCALTLAR